NPDVMTTKGATPLTLAILSDDAQTTLALLVAGCNPRLAHGVSRLEPLLIAANDKSPAVIQSLCEYGAEPNVFDPVGNRSAPIHKLAYRGLVDTVRMYVGANHQRVHLMRQLA